MDKTYVRSKVRFFASILILRYLGPFRKTFQGGPTNNSYDFSRFRAKNTSEPPFSVLFLILKKCAENEGFEVFLGLKREKS